jgi:hypothetical protein
MSMVRESTCSTPELLVNLGQEERNGLRLFLLPKP